MVNPQQIDFLVWVKKVDAFLRHHPTFYNLVDSAIAEPESLWTADLQRWLLSRGEQGGFQSAGVRGDTDLLDRIAKRYRIDTEKVGMLLTNGASQAIWLIYQSLLAPGDHVLIETPVYEPLVAPAYALRLGVSWLNRSPTDRYSISLDAIKSHLERDPTIKLIIISNLHNPSSAWLDDAWFYEVAKLVRKHNDRLNSNLKVLVDEAYHDFVAMRQQPAASFAECFISINSLAKVFGLSLLRCGWILGSPDIIDNVWKSFVLTENIASPLTQALASTIFDNLAKYERHVESILAINREAMNDHMELLINDGLIRGSVPKFGCTYFPELAGIKNTQRLIEWLASVSNIYVAPGHYFGAPSHIRIGFGGTSEKTVAGGGILASRLREYLSTIQS